eukprot:SAG31_NODE_393_length_16293_cov_15.804372_16_plen_438_part_00
MELANTAGAGAEAASAVTIQNAFRGYVSRRKTAAIKEETHAARKIQQMMRGKADRKKLQQKKLLRKRSKNDANSVPIADMQAQNLRVAVEVLQYETEELDDAIKRCPDLSQLGFETLDIAIDDAEVEAVAAQTLQRWVNIQLESAGSDLRLNSISSDLRDGKILATLLDHTASLRVRSELDQCPPADQDAKAAVISKAFAKLNIGTSKDCPGAVLKVAHIVQGSESHLHHALAKLFLSHHRMPSLGWQSVMEETENLLVAIEVEWRAAADSGSITRTKLASLINRVHVYATGLDKLRAKLLDESTRWFNTKRCIERFAIFCINKYLGFMDVQTNQLSRERGDMERGEYDDIMMAELIAEVNLFGDSPEETAEEEEANLRHSISASCAVVYRVFSNRADTGMEDGADTLTFSVVPLLCSYMCRALANVYLYAYPSWGA